MATRNPAPTPESPAPKRARTARANADAVANAATPPASASSPHPDQHMHDYYRRVVEGMVQNPLSDSLNSQLQLLTRMQMQARHLLPPFLKNGQALRNELTEAYQAFLTEMAQHPHQLMQFQARYWQETVDLYLQFWQRSVGVTTEPAPVQDRRFAGQPWGESPVFDFLRHQYLLTSRMMLEAVETFEPKDPKIAHRLRIAVQQYIDAASPANYAATNPEAIAKAVETRGESLLKGMQHLVHDMQAGRITMTDTECFAVGKNIAVTPGSVVLENRLCQLIQFTPTTDQVQELPLLILPPWINKYYILDLSPETSLIRYLVAQGYTVFIVSWKNIGPEEADITWEDYMQLGGLAPMEAVLRICGVPKLNLVGYCIGGTLTATLLSVLKSRRQDIIHTCTFFTAMVDFSETGDIAVYVDEAQMREREEQLAAGGVFSGNAMANAFAFLRANDLVYSYVVNNYLLGKDYTPFDLLYWNSDPTNLPGPMYTWYLRNTYLENNLVQPGKVTLLGHPIDLTQVDVPMLSICTREDHIAPWVTVFRSAKAFGRPAEVVLGASGHIAGVVNPPEKLKREFWHSGDLSQNHTHWLNTATNVKGSWWPYLVQWLGKFNQRLIPARKQLGNAQFPPIEPAPGRYVTAPLPAATVN